MLRVFLQRNLVESLLFRTLLKGHSLIAQGWISPRKSRFREEATSTLIRFHASPLLEFRGVRFWGGRKIGDTREKPSQQDENQQQTQRTYDNGKKSNPSHIAGRRAISPQTWLSTTLHFTKSTLTSSWKNNNGFTVLHYSSPPLNVSVQNLSQWSCEV